MCKGRDALRKYAGGIFLAKAGSNLRLRPGLKAVAKQLRDCFERKTNLLQPLRLASQATSPYTGEAYLTSQKVSKCALILTPLDIQRNYKRKDYNTYAFGHLEEQQKKRL